MMASTTVVRTAHSKPHTLMHASPGAMNLEHSGRRSCRAGHVRKASQVHNVMILTLSMNAEANEVNTK